MNNLFFLDPTPSALSSFSESVRHRVYRRIGDVIRAENAQHSAIHSHGAGKRVSISNVLVDHTSLNVAFGHLADRMVILEVSRADSSMVLQELELVLKTLEHMDLASIGLSVSELPQGSDQGVKVLDGAINLYCQKRLSPRRLYSIDYDTGVDDFIRRLIQNPIRTWGSSEARTKFKDVLDRAERDPQVIERGDRRFVLVDEAQLESLAGRKNAQQMYKHFFEDLEPMEPFERISGKPVGRFLDLG